MRKTLEAIGLVALAILFWVTWAAVDGPNPLPDRIPTHFDLAGLPNAWGPPVTLWFLPVMAVVLYIAMTVVSRFPSSFNYPARVTAENHARLQALALRLIACIKLELVCFFLIIQSTIIEAVRSRQWNMPPFVVPGLIAVMFVTIAWHFVAMRGAGPA
jgi:uncharacterized membrane protein